MAAKRIRTCFALPRCVAAPVNCLNPDLLMESLASRSVLNAPPSHRLQISLNPANRLANLNFANEISSPRIQAEARFDCEWAAIVRSRARGIGPGAALVAQQVDAQQAQERDGACRANHHFVRSACSASDDDLLILFLNLALLLSCFRLGCAPRFIICPLNRAPHSHNTRRFFKPSQRVEQAGSGALRAASAASHGDSRHQAGNARRDCRCALRQGYPRAQLCATLRQGEICNERFRVQFLVGSQDFCVVPACVHCV